MNPESKNILQRIASLRRLRNEMQRQYNELVLPWGLGYEMPEDVSQKATKVMEHADNIQKQIDELESKIGIQSSKNIPEPNARPISNSELYWRTESSFEDLVNAVATRMCWTYDSLNSYISLMGTEFLDVYAPTAQYLTKESAFWEFLANRCRTVLSKIISEADDTTGEPEFRRVVRQELRFYLFSDDTVKAFAYKFMSY